MSEGGWRLKAQAKINTDRRDEYPHTDISNNLQTKTKQFSQAMDEFTLHSRFDFD